MSSGIAENNTPSSIREIGCFRVKPLNPYPMISCTTRKCLVQAIRRNNIMAATTPSNP